MEAQRRQRHRLGCHHVFRALGSVLAPEAERTNTVGVTERQNAVAGDHGHHRIGPFHTLVNGRDCIKNIAGLRLQLATALQFVGEDV